MEGIVTYLIVEVALAGFALLLLLHVGGVT